MTSTQPRQRIVHILEDDQVYCSSLEWTLRSVNYEVCTYRTASDFLKQFQPAFPWCLLIDLLLPGTTGLQLCQKLTSIQANCAFVVLSGHGDLSTAVEIMKLGAVDYLEKPCSRHDLLAAIDRAQELVVRRQQELAEEEQVAARIATLSPREHAVLDAVTAGLATKEIASQLGISPKTVDVHRSKMMQKLSVTSPTQLARVMYLQLRRANRLRRPAALGPGIL